MNNHTLPVAIIGAGPVGLAAAAHLTQRNIPFVLFEAGESVGSNLLSWGHVQVFSPWRYVLDQAAEELLMHSGWKAPDKDGLPSGKELVENYLRPFAELEAIAPHLYLNSKVVSISRKGTDKMKTWFREDQPFSIQVEQQGRIRYFEARAVIDSSGTWNQPNPIGSGGLYAQGEREASDHIFYGIPDVKNKHLDRYQNKKVLVVGSGHSAINALLDLADIQQDHPQTELHWVMRKEKVSDVYGGQEEDALEARGALGIRIEQLVNSDKLHVHTPFHILALSQDGQGIRVAGESRGQQKTLPPIDEIISNTGSRPNLDMIREVRVDLDAALESVFDLAELIDPNVHSCGTVRPHGEAELRHPERDFYVVGSKSYGRAPTFLMATGYEQVRSVIAYLDGDLEAAKRVELNLPETGVCSSDAGNGISCCGPETASPGAKASEASCCG